MKNWNVGNPETPGNWYWSPSTLANTTLVNSAASAANAGAIAWHGPHHVAC